MLSSHSASVWLLLSGLIAFLAPWMSWAKMIALLVPIVAGAYGAFHFGFAPETEAQRQIRSWAAADSRFEDPLLGVALQAPKGWIVLKKDNPLVKVPPAARVAFAQPRLQGFAFLQAESSPAGVASLEQYLNRFQQARGSTTPSLQESERSDVLVGRLPGRKAAATWDDAGVRQKDVSVVWRDGWVYFGLAAWAPEEGAARPQMLDQLVDGVTTQGVLAARLQQAVQSVVQEVPQLTVPAAEMLMARSEAKVLEPDQAFRRSLDALVAGAPDPLESGDPGAVPAHLRHLRRPALEGSRPAGRLRGSRAQPREYEPGRRSRDGPAHEVRGHAASADAAAPPPGPLREGDQGAVLTSRLCS